MQVIISIAGKAFKSIVIVVGTMSVIDFAWSSTRKHETTDKESD